MPTLPIVPYREEIKTLLSRGRALVVTAPPGTGKSTQIPQFFFDELAPDKQMFVLEPRRIAARSLAYRVAEELGGACGEAVGYQVRFERKVSADTRISFLTYGTFLQLLQRDPAAAKAAVIVFDEFHERTLEADASLAWARQLLATVRPDLKLMVLSATLERGPLQTYLNDCASLEVADRSFPVDIRYQPPKTGERLAEQVERAFVSLQREADGGSVLVFLPGVYEIERSLERLYDATRRRGYRLLRLHGKMAVSEQQEVLRAPAKEPCVILSTNVAETSLTIPGVTAVIDSGVARVASYDPERDRNTLFVNRISMQNAAQRAGRAGRLAPGVCVRLWSRDDERAMPPVIVPEVLRLDLAKSMLTLCRLAGLSPEARVLQWLTPPPEERWSKAAADLVRCGAAVVPAGFGTAGTLLLPLTKLGQAMSGLPVEPPIAAILLESRSREERAVNIAMAALWESGESSGLESSDLFDLARNFTSDDKLQSKESRETLSQLERILKEDLPETAGTPQEPARLKADVTRQWMRAFSHRIAANVPGGSLYALKDGRTARLAVKKKPGGADCALPQLIVALAVHERGGRDQAKQTLIPLFLPLEVGWIEEEFPGELSEEVDCRWDEARSRVALEKTTRFRGIACGRAAIEAKGNHREAASAFLARKLQEGIWDWRSDEPRAEQFVFRMKLAATAYPEAGIPAMSGEDWELVFHELCEGKDSLDAAKKTTMLHAIKSYIGPQLAHLIERKAPDAVMLPSGKKARVTYFDAAPPELSARLGDLIGYRDRFVLMDGRVQGVFDILAPNYRTVQKTADLGSFWKNTYPEVKNELKRRYPRHPWP